MTAEIRTRLRHAILEQLVAASDMGLPIKTLHAGCVYAGCPNVTHDHVESECAEYLSREGFVTSAPSLMNAAIERYRITAAGRAYLAATGLA